MSQVDESDERPFKIQKKEKTSDGDDVPTFAPNPDAGHEIAEIEVKEDSEILRTKAQGEDHADAGRTDLNSKAIESVPNSSRLLTTEPEKPMSKSQLKKIRKKQERLEGREAWKASKRAKDKEKKERKRAAAREASNASKQPDASTQCVPKQVNQRPVQVPITFLIDCDFDDLMTEKEITSLSSQLSRSYSVVRAAKLRAHLVISSLGGMLLQRFETVLANNHLGWKGVKFPKVGFLEAAEEAHSVMYGPQGGKIAGALQGSETSAEVEAQNEEDSSAIKVESTSAVHSNEAAEQKEAAALIRHTPTSEDIISAPTSASPSIVYLSSDSPNTLEVLAPYTTYIIGGIVDKNRHKGLCYKKAREAGIPTAKLPIGDYMEMQSRTVLTTNHVIEIMVKWLEVGNWGEAFLEVIPKRKEAKLRGGKEQLSAEDAPGRAFDNETRSES